MPSVGLKTLYLGDNPIIDIIAIHGLGSSPDWAWVRKTDRKDDEGKEVLVNWLSDLDMLPSKIPDSRIMTFNYESQWFLGNLSQRRPLCALQLLRYLKNLRNEEPDTLHRPIIFIGHSFGGIIIEEALVNAVSNEEFQDIISSIAGVIFLGTPLRGSDAQKMGIFVAKSARKLGFHSDDGILKELRKDSEILLDLLDHFVRLTNKHQISVVCFFEQHKTNYVRGRLAIGGLIRFSEMVANESSATITGYPKFPLPTDHLKINKYSGPDDPSFQAVYPELKAMIRGVSLRLKTRTMAMSLLEQSQAEEQRLAQPQPLAQLGNDLKRLETQYLQNLQEMDAVRDALRFYIPPEAMLYPGSVNRFDLGDRVDAFLQTDRKVFLVLGSAGAGKSTFNHALARRLWQKFHSDPFNVDIPIPLYISLASLGLRDDDNDLIGVYLKDHQFSEQQAELLQRHRRFVFILDGYDEIKYRDGNFYQQNKLGKWNAKIIIASRPEYLGPNYECKFYPTEQPRMLEQCWLAPLSHSAILEYIRRFVEANPGGWTTEQYATLIDRPDFKGLLTNPFLLAITISTVPKLLASQTAEKFSRYSLYSTFIKSWLDRAQRRLNNIQMTDPEISAFHRLWENDQFTPGCLQYCKQFALTLYRKQAIEVAYNTMHDDSSDWRPFFRDDTAEVRLFRFNSPLIRQGNKYRFIHKSIRDFFVAQMILEDLTTGATEEYGRRKEKQDYLINEFHLVEDFAIIDFIVEYIKGQPSLKRPLLECVELSKKYPEVHRAAANSITVLVRIGHNFCRANLSNIRIPNANLSFGIFHHTNLQHADLRNVKLRGTWLKGADCTGALMSGVQFGEAAILGDHTWASDVRFSRNGKILASCSAKGFVSLWSADGQLLMTLIGCHHFHNRSCFSPDGNTIATYSDDANVYLWSTTSGRLTRTLSCSGGRINGIAFSPNGDIIASYNNDGTIRLWAMDGQLLWTLSGHTSSISRVVFSRDGKILASCSSDKTICLWSTNGQLLQVLKGHTKLVNEVAFSPDGKIIASGSYDKTVRLWSIHGHQLHTLEGHTSFVNGVVFLPECRALVSYSHDKTVRLWSFDGHLLQALEGHSGPVNLVIASPNGKVLASCSTDSTIRLWSTDGQALQTLEGHTNTVSSIDFSPDGKTLASSSGDGTVRLWAVEEQQLIQPFQDYVSAPGRILSPPDQTLASGDIGRNFSISFWSTEGSRVLVDLEPEDSKNQTDDLPFIPACFLPDNKTFALWNPDNKNTIYLQSISNAQVDGVSLGFRTPSLTLNGHTATVLSVVTSGDGQVLASLSEDKTVRLWFTNGKLLHTLENRSNYTKAALSPDGSVLALWGVNDQGVQLWSVKSGILMSTLEDNRNNAERVVISFSPNGKILASFNGVYGIQLWSVENGQLLKRLECHGNTIERVVFSPDCYALVSCSWSNAVHLWSIEGGQLLETLACHGDTIVRVVFSPNTKALVSFGRGNVVQLWSVRNGQLLRTLEGHRDTVDKAVFSPDSKVLASYGRDHTISLWSVEDGRLLDTLEGFTLSRSRPLELNTADIVFSRGATIKDLTLYLCDEDGNFFVFQNTFGDHGHFHLELSAVWRATPSLEVANMCIETAEDLNLTNKRLLFQRGAIGINIDEVNDFAEKFSGETIDEFSDKESENKSIELFLGEESESGLTGDL